MELDDVLLVTSFSDLAIQTLIDRLQRSHSAEHCIYREVELDELWRLIDIATNAVDANGLRNKARLCAMRDAVHNAHDLVGRDNRPMDAADVLRGLLVTA